MPIEKIITISTEQAVRNQVADYCDLRELANRLSIPIYWAETYSLKSPADVANISSMGIDIAFVVGWQRLIPGKVLSQIRIGAFGMHGSSMNLPRGRGRSPMNWSIIEDRRVFHTNLFKYDSGVDSGDILDTLKFNITEKDTAETMHYKNVLAMKHLISKNIDKLIACDFVLTKQQNLPPTYYPKRTPDDSLIDWERDVFYIERFTRAVTKPFNGSFSFIEDKRILINRAQVFDLNDFGYTNIPAGTIVEVFDPYNVLVKCIGGLLLITDFLFEGEVRAGQVFGYGGRTVRHFPTNKFGHYDINESDLK